MPRPVRALNQNSTAMCRIIKISRAKKAVGYKVVLLDKDSGKLYSPATFVEYKPGKVPSFTPGDKYYKNTYGERIRTFFVPPTEMAKGGFAYNERMAGKTAVFLRKRDAKQLALSISFQFYIHRVSDKFEIKIARMELADDDGIAVASYSGEQCRAGNRILSIKLVG